MRRDDLMKRDLVSEMILLGSGIVIALSVIITLMRSPEPARCHETVLRTGFQLL
jgi:hypothetical protein